jgi:arylsulfatase A-like enzyme
VSTRRPNVLLLFAAQHRGDVLGIERHPDVATPHLDKLAHEGARFTHAFAQSAECGPSRTALMTGLYPRTTGCLAEGDCDDVLQCVYPMAQAFADAGYVTAAFGKRNLACPPHVVDNGWSITHDGYLEDSPAECGIAPHTIDFIRQHAGGEKPFFCWASFPGPHPSQTPVPKFLNQYDATHWGKGKKHHDGIHMPPTLHDPIDHLPPSVRATFERPSTPVAKARKDESHYRHYLANYYACVEEVDEHVGAILHALEAAQIDHNTIVVYASDHGDFLGCHGMLDTAGQAQSVYLDTLHIPLIMRYPGRIQKEHAAEELVELIDLYPTLVELAGIQLPALDFPLVGRSLVGTLTGKHQLERTFAIAENWLQSTVITSDHVLGIWQDPSGKAPDMRGKCPDMLFDLVKDADQTRNVLTFPAQKMTRERLLNYFKEWDSHTSALGKQCVLAEAT